MTTKPHQGIIVTGGSRGIGLALIERLLADGHSVATCSRRPTPNLETLQKQYPGHLFWQAATLGHAEAEQDFIQNAIDWLGKTPLWALVNNAAIAGEGVLATYPTIDIENIIATNLTSTLRVTRLAIRHMLKSEQPARIVSISSIVAQRGYTGLATYAASKAGLEGMTRALAREVGRCGITVNVVAPGYVSTELSASLSPEQKQQIIKRTPLARLAEPADIIPAVAFLLSPESVFMTGQVMTIDGGLTL